MFRIFFILVTITAVGCADQGKGKRKKSGAQQTQYPQGANNQQASGQNSGNSADGMLGNINQYQQNPNANQSGNQAGGDILSQLMGMLGGGGGGNANMLQGLLGQLTGGGGGQINANMISQLLGGAGGAGGLQNILQGLPQMQGMDLNQLLGNLQNNNGQQSAGLRSYEIEDQNAILLADLIANSQVQGHSMTGYSSINVKCSSALMQNPIGILVIKMDGLNKTYFAARLLRCASFSLDFGTHLSDGSYKLDTRLIGSAGEMREKSMTVRSNDGKIDAKISL